MKKLLYALSFFALLFLSLNASAQNGKKNEKVTIKTNIFCDHCKECPSCGKGMSEKLLSIPGVKMVELDDKKMTLTVFYNGQKTNADAIRTAISKLGYDADEIKADPVAYENLDGCCKKS